MSKQAASKRMGKFVTVLLAANLCFWIYFVIAFAQASYPFRLDPWGHPAGAGYTFAGHSIGILESPFTNPFFKLAFWAEFPSFAVARGGHNLLFPHVTGDQFFAGISEGAWRLLTIVALSFFQWYVVGWVGQKLWQKWFGHSGGIPNQAPLSGPAPPSASTGHSFRVL